MKEHILCLSNHLCICRNSCANILCICNFQYFKAIISYKLCTDFVYFWIGICEM